MYDIWMYDDDGEARFVVSGIESYGMAASLVANLQNITGLKVWAEEA